MKPTPCYHQPSPVGTPMERVSGVVSNLMCLVKMNAQGYKRALRTEFRVILATSFNHPELAPMDGWGYPEKRLNL